jgi:hypothetical protein
MYLIFILHPLPFLKIVLTLGGPNLKTVMADINQPTNTESFLEEPGKLPSMLNVLTILTIIWNCISLLLSVFGYARAPANYDSMVQNQDKMDQAPAFVRNMMGPDPVGAARRAMENRLPVMLLGLVGAGLCLYAALEMRKRKKIGFSIYIIGDLVPFATIIFLGTSGLTGIFGIIGIAIMLLFIFMYASQLKYMK